MSMYDWYQARRLKQELQKSIQHRTTVIKDYVTSSGQKKLQIGCGSNELEGWLNTDLNATQTIVYLDAGHPFPLENETIDFIYNEHIFEHLNIDQQLNMLGECYRVLKKGGVLRTATPNLEFLIQLYQNPAMPLHTKYARWAMSHSKDLVRAQHKEVAQEHYPVYILSNFLKAWGHQVVHDTKSFESLAKQVSFKNVTFCAVGESAHPALQNIEKHGAIIPQEYNTLETMVIELTK